MKDNEFTVFLRSTGSRRPFGRIRLYRKKPLLPSSASPQEDGGRRSLYSPILLYCTIYSTVNTIKRLHSVQYQKMSLQLSK